MHRCALHLFFLKHFSNFPCYLSGRARHSVKEAEAIHSPGEFIINFLKKIFVQCSRLPNVILHNCAEIEEYVVADLFFLQQFHHDFLLA